MIKKDKAIFKKSVIGTWCTIPSPSVVSIIASSGLDFVILDMEHGSFNIETIENCIAAAERCGCAPLVRVSNLSDICKVLDVGAHGIVIPHIDDVTSAKKTLEYIKYYPQGKRSFSPYTYSGKFGSDIEKYICNENKKVAVVFVVESTSGLMRLKDISSIGPDVIYIGQYDLSQEIGCHGDVRKKAVVDTLEKNVKIIRDNGVSVGAIAHNIKEIKYLDSIGVNFITYLVDSNVLYKSYNSTIMEFKSK